MKSTKNRCCAVLKTRGGKLRRCRESAIKGDHFCARHAPRIVEMASPHIDAIRSSI